MPHSKKKSHFVLLLIDLLSNLVEIIMFDTVYYAKMQMWQFDKKHYKERNLLSVVIGLTFSNSSWS